MRPTARPYGPADRRWAGAVDRERALKPDIPGVSPDNGIPLRDLLELELPLRVPGGAAVVRTPGR